MYLVGYYDEEKQELTFEVWGDPLPDGMSIDIVGQILGFSTSSADVRISQYESDKKKPRENVIENLAYKLDVSPQAIDIPDIETYIGAIYTLFQLERSYGLKIDELDGQPILI